VWIWDKPVVYAKQIRNVSELIVRLHYVAVIITTPDMPHLTRDEMDYFLDVHEATKFTPHQEVKKKIPDNFVSPDIKKLIRFLSFTLNVGNYFSTFLIMCEPKLFTSFCLNPNIFRTISFQTC
jgi:hypothetical protein